MSFSRPLHWAEGLFLQPQHFQRFQQNLAQDMWEQSALYQSYPFGVIDLEVDSAALATQRVVLTKLRAIMPDGTLLDMPHNATVAPLLLTPPTAQPAPQPQLLQQQQQLLQADTLNPAAAATAPQAQSRSAASSNESIEICLCVPQLSAQQSNICELPARTGRFTLCTTEVADENISGGEQEVTVVLRRYNAFLCERALVPAHVCALPLLKVHWEGNNQGQLRLVREEEYMAPFVTVSASCPILPLCQELVLTLRQQQLQMQHQLNERALEQQVMTAADVIDLHVLSALTSFVARAQSLVQPELLSPLALYMMLVDLLAQISVRQPQVQLQIPAYVHEDALPCFKQVLRLIRLFLHEEQAGDCQIFAFVPHSANTLLLQFTEVATLESNEIYLALQLNPQQEAVTEVMASTAATAATGLKLPTIAAGGSSKMSLMQIASAIEAGDNFRLLDPTSYNERIRGVKLSYVRYPPQYLPQGNYNLLFRVKMDESARVWQYILSDKAMLIDYAAELWGPVQAQLMVVTGK